MTILNAGVAVGRIIIWSALAEVIVRWEKSASIVCPPTLAVIACAAC